MQVIELIGRYLGAFFIGVLLVIFGLDLFLRYIARGEPDVNGDPERDGGWPVTSIRRTDLVDYLRIRRAVLETKITRESAAQTPDNTAVDIERAALAEIATLELWANSQH